MITANNKGCGWHGNLDAYRFCWAILVDANGINAANVIDKIIVVIVFLDL